MNYNVGTRSVMHLKYKIFTANICPFLITLNWITVPTKWNKIDTFQVKIRVFSNPSLNPFSWPGRPHQDLYRSYYLQLIFCLQLLISSFLALFNFAIGTRCTFRINKNQYLVIHWRLSIKSTSLTIFFRVTLPVAWTAGPQIGISLPSPTVFIMRVLRICSSPS